MGFLRSFVLAQAGILSLANADASNLNPNGDGCVDPSAYLQCYQNNVDQLSICMTDAKKTCSAGADSEDADTLQEYRVQGSYIPYYPAPDNAPGGCVCNLGYVYGNYTVTFLDVSNGCDASALDGVSTTASCECCLDSSVLSNIIQACPHNDLSALSIDTWIESFQFGYNESASDDCSILDDGTGSQCMASFTFESEATTWYNPGQLPSGYPGTAPLSDTTDAGSLTVAPEPYTFSLFPAYTSVISPVPYNAKAVTAVNTGTAAQSATETGTGASSTATDSASSSKTSKGAARNLVSPISSGMGVWGLAIYSIACAVCLV
ncbi:hypothetical protein N7490_011660 [Penicillium lividum]|nr:hypothetical protein N7490_011660 [Penicillium lividum]